MRAIILVLSFSMMACARAQLPLKSGDVKTTGSCNQTATGSQNTFILNCTVRGADGKRVVSLLNQLLQDREHLDERLDTITRLLTSPPPQVHLKTYISQRDQNLAIEVGNFSEQIVRDVTWSLMLWRSSDNQLFSYATKDIGYLKPRSKSANYLMDLAMDFHFPVGPVLRSGDELIGKLQIDCPTCAGEVYLIHINYQKDGWISQIHDFGSIPWPDLNEKLPAFYKFVNAVPAQGRENFISR